MKRALSIFAAAFIAGSLLAQSIDLPAPQKTGGMPLMDALAKRSTARAFDSKELSPQQLSSLLWAAFGINRPDGKRTAPSARKGSEQTICNNFPLRGPVPSRCLLKRQRQAARQPATAPPPTKGQSESARGVVRHAVRERRGRMKFECLSRPSRRAATTGTGRANDVSDSHEPVGS
jgi:hypothetical protein